MNSYLKSIKQKYQQKKNWAKYRFHYMNGIHSYNRQKNAKSKQTIFSKLLKSKLYETENQIVFLEDNSYLQELIIVNPSNEHEYLINEIMSNLSEKLDKVEFEIILSCFLDSIILTNNMSSLTEEFIERKDNNKMNKLSSLKGLLGLNEEIIDSMPKVYNDPEENSGVSDMLNKMYNDDMSNTPVATISSVYDFNKDSAILDHLTVFLETELKSFGVKNVDIEFNMQELYFDLVFNSKDALTFTLYVDGTGRPIIECRAAEGRGSQMHLPLNYSVDYKIEIPSNFMFDFPIDYIKSCIENYAPDSYTVNESQIAEFCKYPVLTQNLDEMRFRKVIRDGVIKWVRSKPKRFRNKRLSMTQKIAIKMAQKKAHTSSAERHRDKSQSLSKRIGLYGKPQFRFRK